MSDKSTYVIADLILTLVSVGIQAEAIRAELDAMKAAGKTDDEVNAYLRQLAATELQKAKDAVQ